MRDGISYFIEVEGKNQKEFAAYENAIANQGGFPVALGTVQIYKAGGSADFIIPAVVLGSQVQDSFRLTRDVVYNGLLLAAANPNIRTVAIPTIGSGVSGSLTEGHRNSVAGHIKARGALVHIGCGCQIFRCFRTYASPLD